MLQNTYFERLAKDKQSSLLGPFVANQMKCCGNALPTYVRNGLKLFSLSNGLAYWTDAPVAKKTKG
jgi:hypothetical protein